MRDLRLMLHFAVVAEELSFTRAAQRLQLAQPWLSARIRQLEDSLGMVLFERAGRRISLTPNGQRMYEAARPLLAAIQTFEDDVTEIKRGNVSVLRVGALTVGTRDLRQKALFDLFERKDKSAQIVVEKGYTKLLLDRLRRGKLDIAFGVGPISDEALEAITFSTYNIGILMRAFDPLACRGDLKVSDLAGRKILASDQPLNREIIDFLDRIANENVAVQRIRDINESMLFEPEHGPHPLLFTIAPEMSDPLYREDIVRRNIVGAPTTTVYLIRRRQAVATPPAERFWKMHADMMRMGLHHPHD